MADKKVKLDETKEEKIISKISSFVTIYKKWILIGIAALVVILFASIIIASISKKSNEKAYERIAKLELQLNDVIDSTDSSINEKYIEDLESEIKGSKYNSVKAAYILGEYYAAKEDWNKSYDYFMKAYNLNNKIYLASLAAFNAAVAADEKGDVDTALALYLQVSDDTENIIAPKALFNVARIYMEKGNKELAIATFQQLADTYTYSEYAALSKNIISAN